MHTRIQGQVCSKSLATDSQNYEQNSNISTRKGGKEVFFGNLAGISRLMTGFEILTLHSPSAHWLRQHRWNKIHHRYLFERDRAGRDLDLELRPIRCLLTHSQMIWLIDCLKKIIVTSLTALRAWTTKEPWSRSSPVTPGTVTCILPPCPSGTVMVMFWLGSRIADRSGRHRPATKIERKTSSELGWTLDEFDVENIVRNNRSRVSLRFISAIISFPNKQSHAACSDHVRIAGIIS